MNLIDHVISAVSPEAGLRRARARAATVALTRHYEGASVGRRTEGWITAGTDANAEVGPALNRLRNRARDLVRNNAYAAKAVTALATNLIGTGIIPRARADDPALAEAADIELAELTDLGAGAEVDDFVALTDTSAAGASMKVSVQNLVANVELDGGVYA